MREENDDVDDISVGIEILSSTTSKIFLTVGGLIIGSFIAFFIFHIAIKVILTNVAALIFISIVIYFGSKAMLILIDPETEALPKRKN